MSAVERINWDNIPQTSEGVPNPHYPALLDRAYRGNRVARLEATADQVSHNKVFAALDELRFGVEQLTGESC